MNPIKIGIVGIGRAGWGMHCGELENRQDKFQIVAAADIDASRVALMTKRYNGCAGAASIEEMLENQEVEMVAVASPSTYHVDHAIAALEAGRYVFLEKPVALNIGEIDRLTECSSRHKGKLYCRHNRRFEPGFVHIREIIAEGLLGEVYEVKMHRHGYQRRDDWQTLISCGGGQLNNWGPHIMDQALQFLDSPVTNLWSDLKKIAAVGDAEDHLKVVLTGENRRVVDFEISGGVAIGGLEHIVYGTKGSLTCDGREIHLKYLDPDVPLMEAKARVESPPLDNRFGNAEKLRWIEKTIKVAPAAVCDTDTIWDHLFASVREGAEYPVTLAEATEVVRQTAAVKAGTEFEA